MNSYQEESLFLLACNDTSYPGDEIIFELLSTDDGPAPNLNDTKKFKKSNEALSDRCQAGSPSESLEHRYSSSSFSDQDRRTQYPTDEHTKDLQSQPIPLFEIHRRPALPIKADSMCEQSYNHVRKGNAKETKTLKTYHARQQKHLALRHFHQHLSKEEMDIVNGFKNNLEGIQQLYGFEDRQDQLAETGKSDGIRQECLKYCHGAASSILNSAGQMDSKLFQLKYLNNMEDSVLQPENFKLWKSSQ